MLIPGWETFLAEGNRFAQLNHTRWRAAVPEFASIEQAAVFLRTLSRADQLEVLKLLL